MKCRKWPSDPPLIPTTTSNLDLHAPTAEIYSCQRLSICHHHSLTAYCNQANTIFQSSKPPRNSANSVPNYLILAILTGAHREGRETMASAAGVAIAQPLFTFGLISDVQYANIPDGCSFLGVPRYYRHSILILQRAVKEWNTHQKHKFAINFGDIVDGFCPKDQSLNAVKKVVDEFEMFRGPVHHMIGNHCLYNLPRTELLPLLKIQTLDGRAYYDFSPVPEYRFVVLDSYDISAIGWPRDHPKTLEALKLLSEKNPNEDKNSPTNLEGVERRFLMFNGGVGKEQMEWLDGVLQEATTLKQKVVVCCHLPLDPGAAFYESLTWNYDEVMSLIHRYNCVKVCFAGHNHKGGYCIDSHGVHHRVLEAALECPPGTDAFGSVNVYDDKISLVGTDRMVSTDMHFNPQ